VGLADRRFPRQVEWLVPLGLAAIALLLRAVDLATRGPWDVDQGRHLLTVMDIVRDGSVPLLGPTTQLPGVHHGAIYYYLLTPAAALSDTDPTIVTLTFVLAGVVAVLGVWWLAWAIAGPIAGASAGLLMATSAIMVSTSSWIWNPHLVAAAMSVALIGAWLAWARRRPLGWVLAAIGLTVAIGCHVLSAFALPAFIVAWVADVRRTSPADPAARTPLLAAGGLALVAGIVGFLPLIAHELGTDMAELRALAQYVADLWGSAGGSPDGPGLPVRLVLVALRITEWPLVGLFVDALPLAIAVAVFVVGVIVWRIVAGGADERDAAIFAALALTTGWIALALTVPSLATVVRELPVDHYHAFLDPLVVVVAGVGLAALARRGRAGTAVAAVALVGLVAWNLATQPAAVAGDGGWPAAERAGERIIDAAGDAPLAFIGLPSIKGPDAYLFPVTRRGALVVTDGEALPPGGVVVVLCEDLWTHLIGAACGGPAEDPAAASSPAASGRPLSLIERFAPAPGRLLSLYRVASG